MKIVTLKDIPATTTSHNKIGRKKQIIANGEVMHLAQFAQTALLPREAVAKHKHADLYEIFFVESGSGIIKIDGKEFMMKKGTCITIEPNENHEVINTGSEELLLTYFAILV